MTIDKFFLLILVPPNSSFIQIIGAWYQPEKTNSVISLRELNFELVHKIRFDFRCLFELLQNKEPSLKTRESFLENMSMLYFQMHIKCSMKECVDVKKSHQGMYIFQSQMSLYGMSII